MLVEDDESLNLVNQLGMDNLVAVKVTESSSTKPMVTTTKPIVTTTAAAPKLGLSTELTASASEVNVVVIAKSEKGQ